MPIYSRWFLILASYGTYSPN